MSDACCSHGCAPTAAAQSPRYRRVLWAALIVNALMFAVELAGGLRAGSVSLLADAVDYLGDAANYGISLLVSEPSSLMILATLYGLAFVALAWLWRTVTRGRRHQS